MLRSFLAHPWAVADLQRLLPLAQAYETISAQTLADEYHPARLALLLSYLETARALTAQDSPLIAVRDPEGLERAIRLVTAFQAAYQGCPAAAYYPDALCALVRVLAWLTLTAPLDEDVLAAEFPAEPTLTLMARLGVTEDRRTLVHADDLRAASVVYAPRTTVTIRALRGYASLPPWLEAQCTQAEQEHAQAWAVVQQTCDAIQRRQGADEPAGG